MLIKSTDFDGAKLIELEPLRDERGLFARTFCERVYAESGLTSTFPQHSMSYTAAAGTIRGMHFQRGSAGEVKVVNCMQGAIFDVIIDLRAGSSTHGRWQGFHLSVQNRTRLYIPKGFAHGFQTLTDDAEVAYLISAFYAPEAAGGVRYDDSFFSIRWPRPVTTVSDKDRRWPNYDGQGI